MLVTVSFLPFKTEVNPQNPTFNVNVNGRKNPSHFPVIMFNTKQVSYRFTNMRVPKVLLPPLKIRFYGQKLALMAKHLSLWSIVVLCPTKNNGNEVPRWFSDIGVPELLLPPKMVRMFGPETAIYAPQ